jgi:hypothetical protein
MNNRVKKILVWILVAAMVLPMTITVISALFR